MVQASALLMVTEDEAAAASYVQLLVGWTAQAGSCVGAAQEGEGEDEDEEEGHAEDDKEPCAEGILLALLSHPVPAVRAASFRALAGAARGVASAGAALSLARRPMVVRAAVLGGLSDERCCEGAAGLVEALVASGAVGLARLRRWRAWLECHAGSPVMGGQLGGALALLQAADSAAAGGGEAAAWRARSPHLRALFSRSEVRRQEGAAALRATLGDDHDWSEAAADPFRALLDGGAAVGFRTASAAVNDRALARFSDKARGANLLRDRALPVTLSPGPLSANHLPLMLSGINIYTYQS